MYKVILLLFFVFNSIAFSYHHQFVLLKNAEQLYSRQIVPAISHRFLGEPMKSNGFFGQHLGANVAYELKIGLSSNQVLSYSSTSLYNQQTFVYKKSKKVTDIIWVGGCLNIDNFKLTAQQQTTLSVTVFSGIVSESFDMVFNGVYKDFFSQFQLGLGASRQFVPRMKIFIELLTPIKKYAPNAVVLTGVKIMTFGHNFYIFVSNQNDEGYIPATSGARGNQFYTGFKIERIFDF